MDGEAEQELYDKYKCWCTKVINAKTTSIAANEARIQELAASGFPFLIPISPQIFALPKRERFSLFPLPETK